MLAYAVIACQSESVVHVAYGVWVCLWEPRPYRGFQSVAMCLVLAMFGVRMCPSYLLISFCSRTWSFFFFSCEVHPTIWIQPDLSYGFLVTVSAGASVTHMKPMKPQFFRRNLTVFSLVFRGPDPCPIPHGYVRAKDLCDKMWKSMLYIYIYLLNFLFVFISSFYFEVFQNFVLDVLKLGKDWNHQNLIGLGCPGAVQSSLGLRQLDLRAGRIDG